MFIPSNLKLFSWFLKSFKIFILYKWFIVSCCLFAASIMFTDLFPFCNPKVNTAG